MPTPSCRFQPHSQHRRPRHPKTERAQALVIMAACFAILLVVMGLSIDVGNFYLNYTRLKRAVDAASIGAANDFRRNEPLTRLTAISREILAMHELNLSTIDEHVYICDADGDGVTDASLQSLAPSFYANCPASGELPRKLVYVRATQKIDLYFLSLIGFSSFDVTTDSVAEAAPIDIVLVFDTSESMGINTTGYVSDDFDPTVCNGSNDCHPLKEAKDAAKDLIDTLYPEYDRVSVVTFAQVAQTQYALSGDLTAAKTAIDNNVLLNDDAPRRKLFPKWGNWGHAGKVNPVNPEDRDNDGQDGDNAISCTPGTDRWDDTLNIPCDESDKIDAFDWNGNGTFDTSDDNASQAWIASHGNLPMAIVSTCTGCGIREGASILKQTGRPSAVWIMVFLSDGAANMSDTPLTNAYDATDNPYGVKSIYINGYCGGGIDSGYWLTNCIKKNDPNRYCIKDNPNSCPPGTVKLTATGSGYSEPYSPPYSADDYARDMIDEAALLTSSNPNEDVSRGNDIGVYTIGLGPGTALYGENLLRYMSAVGDDGDRDTDPCNGAAARTSCGQYYYAPAGSSLKPIFENIASRIYTRLTN
jgi:hypothetical protein